MPQAHLPLIPYGCTEISNLLSVTRKDKKFVITQRNFKKTQKKDLTEF